AAAAVDLHRRAGVGHLVPVDREAGARDVRAPGDADALARWQLPVLLIEVGPLPGALQALPEAHRRDSQVVHRARVRGLEDPLAVGERVEPDIPRALAELALGS